MAILKKRETPIQNIAYMSIMAAINVIFVLLTSILPFLLFLLIFLLPLTSAIVTVYCEKRYYPVYFVVTLALCILVSYGFTIFDTLVYVLPSLITGFVFGICFEKNVPSIIMIVGNSILQFLLSLLTFYVLGYIVSNLNMMNVLISALGLTEFAYKETFTLLFLYIIAMIQIVLSYIFIKKELNRLTVLFNLDNKNRIMVYIAAFVLYGLTIISYFYFPVWTMVFVLMPLPFFIYELITIILTKNKIAIVLAGIAHLGFAFGYAFTNKYIVAPNQLMFLITLFGLTTIIDILNNYCFAKSPK